MKIIKIEKWEEDKIIVTLEEYPHAQPVFNANISKSDLETALKAWAINQDEVDAINAQRIEEAKPIQELKLSNELKEMEGLEV
jgi:hypothetical protein